MTLRCWLVHRWWNYDDSNIDNMLEDIFDDLAKNEVNMNEYKIVLNSKNSIDDYKKMKSKLCIEVISSERNTELLQNIPHERMEDMAVVYSFLIDQTDTENKRILITNKMLDQYGISKEQLRDDALENAPKHRPVQDTGLLKTIVEMSGDERIPGIEFATIPEDEPVRVVTVPGGFNGAGVIAYPNFMNDMARKLNGNFYILPCSIHEVLIVKEDSFMEPRELRNMVEIANSTEIKPEDRLTDSVYFYNQERKTLTTV